MENNRAFARARMMAAAILAITNNLEYSLSQQQDAITRLGPYKSRGHGKGKRHGSRTKIYSKIMRQKNTVMTSLNQAGLLVHLWFSGNGSNYLKGGSPI